MKVSWSKSTYVMEITFKYVMVWIRYWSELEWIQLELLPRIGLNIFIVEKSVFITIAWLLFKLSIAIDTKSNY